MGEGFSFLPTDDLRSDEIALMARDHILPAPGKDDVPTYGFDIVHARTGERLGEILLRVGENEATYYGGNISYGVLPRHRGHHYAAKACALIAALARRHGMARLYIACRPNNTASRRTCEALGAALLGITHVPKHLALYQNGMRTACIYEVAL